MNYCDSNPNSVSEKPSLSDRINHAEARSAQQARQQEIEQHMLNQNLLSPEPPLIISVVTVEEQGRQAQQQVKPSPAHKNEGQSDSKRTIQVKTRLSQEEKALLDQRVADSGLNQGDFIREILLDTPMTFRQVTQIDVDAIERLLHISADLGKIGGLIRGCVIRNKTEFDVMTPETKAALEKEIRDLCRLKQEIRTFLEETYGNSETHT